MSERHDTDFMRAGQEENPIQTALGLLASMAESLATIAASMQQGRPQSTEDEDKESLAIACLLTLGTNLSAISRHVGVTRQSLYRMRRFVAFLEKMKGPTTPGRIRRGTKHGKTRIVEAEDD